MFGEAHIIPHMGSVVNAFWHIDLIVSHEMEWDGEEEEEEEDRETDLEGEERKGKKGRRKKRRKKEEENGE